MSLDNCKNFIHYSVRRKLSNSLSSLLFENISHFPRLTTDWKKILTIDIHECFFIIQRLQNLEYLLSTNKTKTVHFVTCQKDLNLQNGTVLNRLQQTEQLTYLSTMNQIIHLSHSPGAVINITYGII